MFGNPAVDRSALTVTGMTPGRTERVFLLWRHSIPALRYRLSPQQHKFAQGLVVARAF